MLDPGWAAIIGATLGGVGTLLGSAVASVISDRSSKERDERLVQATALLMQDDFYHFQVTLARALVGQRWWTSAEVLKQQTTIDDRKTAWASLSNKAVELPALAGDCGAYVSALPPALRLQAPNTVVGMVADAQGWMDYLIQHRKALELGEGRHPSPEEGDYETMRWTFVLLDIGRRALQKRANHRETSFTESHVLSSLGCADVSDLLKR